MSARAAEQRLRDFQAAREDQSLHNLIRDRFEMERARSAERAKSHWDEQGNGAKIRLVSHGITVVDLTHHGDPSYIGYVEREETSSVGFQEDPTIYLSATSARELHQALGDLLSRAGGDA